MTERAREVLQDCKTALADFEAAGPTPYWRTRWAGLVTLLRAVGHVLKKVDGSSSPTAKAAITIEYDELQKTRPEPKIYWQFILDERNNVLKAYQFGMHLNTTVRPGAAWFNVRTGETGGHPPGPTTYEYFMRPGTFEGQNPVDVATRAIAFWEDHLKRIEARLLLD